jgi:hypothetical protein
MKWTAREIARTLYIHAFKHKHLVVVPNCYFPGSECDILVVRTDLRMIDVEIKISRSDLKADAQKDKWFDHWTWEDGCPWLPMEQRPAPTKRSHPKRIWKHYYAMPAEIWTPELEEFIQPASGVVLLKDHKTQPFAVIHRQAKPSKDASKISMEELCDVARLSTVRMWESFGEVDQARRKLEQTETV